MIFFFFKTKARRQPDAERSGRREERETERQRERGRLLRREFWGNSENAVFSGGATLNQPSTMRGALPSVCRVTPPSSVTLARHAALALPLQPKAELL